MTLVVVLSVHAERYRAFEAFEERAASVMARYGGRVERRVVMKSAGDGPVREVHVVTFPGAAAFAAYCDDPETRRSAGGRDGLIATTEILTGEDAAPFSAAGGS
jgi:antibiotic biosynthesis monooxygenase (ABM) superfamily enzyme